MSQQKPSIWLRWRELSRSRRAATAYVVSATAVFAALYGLLDPLGGLEVIQRNLSKQTLSYLLLLAVSLTAAGIAALAGGASDGNDEKAEQGGFRTRLNVPESLLRAQHRVFAVGLSLPSFTTEQAIASYTELLGRGVEITLCMMNPLSPALLQRPSRLYPTHAPVWVTAANSLRCLTLYRDQLSREQAERFKVLVMNVLPSSAIVIVDDECLWHPYLDIYTGAKSPYILGSTSKGYGVHMLHYAETLGRQAEARTATVDSAVLLEYLAKDPDARFSMPAAASRAAKRALQ